MKAKDKAIKDFQEYIKIIEDGKMTVNYWQDFAEDVKKYFGENSTHYEFLKTRPPKTMDDHIELIKGYIETIKTKGIIKRPKHNILSDMKNYQIYGIWVGFLSAGFTAGQFFDIYTNTNEIKERTELLNSVNKRNDSLVRILRTYDIADNKSKNETSRNKADTSNRIKVNK